MHVNRMARRFALSEQRIHPLSSSVSKSMSRLDDEPRIQPQKRSEIKPEFPTQGRSAPIRELSQLAPRKTPRATNPRISIHFTNDAVCKTPDTFTALTNSETLYICINTSAKTTPFNDPLSLGKEAQNLYPSGTLEASTTF
jgi:hypothetical protein